MNDLELSLILANGNESAAEFLRLWAEYCHAIDDIVDGDERSAQHVIRSFATGACVFHHPFYLQNLACLRQIVLLVSNEYADSVEFEKSPEPWKRAHADVLRHAGNLMVIAVAQLCGGWDHARKISVKQREACYRMQHPETLPFNSQEAATS